MMAIPLTPSRFGTSFSASQAPYTADAPSMADSLPSADFGFNDLREVMASFTMRFDGFLQRGRKQVLEERNAFRMSVAELEESQRARRQAISDLEYKSNTHAVTLEKEVQETEEMHTAINSLNHEKEERLARRAQLQAEIEEAQAAVKQKRAAQAAYQRSLDAEARHNLPELHFWEQCLGLRVEGTEAGGDRLRFCFSCVDKRDAQREAWFELDLGGRDFRVMASRPRLETEEVEAVEEKLNETRDIGVLLKGMRSLFVAAMKT